MPQPHCLTLPPCPTVSPLFKSSSVEVALPTNPNPIALPLLKSSWPLVNSGRLPSPSMPYPTCLHYSASPHLPSAHCLTSVEVVVATGQQVALAVAQRAVHDQVHVRLGAGASQVTGRRLYLRTHNFKPGVRSKVTHESCVT